MVQPYRPQMVQNAPKISPGHQLYGHFVAISCPSLPRTPPPAPKTQRKGVSQIRGRVYQSEVGANKNAARSQTINLARVARQPVINFPMHLGAKSRRQLYPPVPLNHRSGSNRSPDPPIWVSGCLGAPPGPSGPRRGPPVLRHVEIGFCRF